MKKLFLLALAALLGACTAYNEPEQLAVDSQQLSGPVAAYSFDEASGSTAFDSTSNHLNGTLNGATRVAGKYGSAVKTTGGTSSWVTVADATPLHLTTGMTLEAWVNPTTLTSWRSVLYKEGAGTFDYGLYANNASNHPGTLVVINNSERLEFVGTKLATNTWTHIAGTFNGTNLRFYRNGVLAGTLNVSGSIAVNGGVLRMGGSAIEPAEMFNGIIDEVRIYNRALSATEITTDMNTPISDGSDAPADAPTDVASESSDTSDAGPDATDESNDAGQEAAAEASPDAADESQPDSAADAADEPDTTTGGDDAAPDALADASDEDAGPGDDGGQEASADAGQDAGTEDAAPDAGDGGSAGLYPVQKLGSARYLVTQNGTPFFIQGEAAWSLIANLTLEEAETYLTDRQARGVNTIITNLIEHKFSSNPPKNRYGEAPFTTTGDFSTPNPAYFAHADQFINLAASHGIQMLLFPIYLGNNGGGEGWYQELVANGTAKASGWGAYVGTRYASFDNIIWVMSGDFTPPASGIALVDAVANGIKAHDSRHLMGSHGSSFSSYPVRPWTDIDAIYTYQPVGPEVLDAYMSQTQPTFLIETEYENEGATRQGLRQHAYESVLNGGTGQVCGNSPIWFFGAGWPAALNSTGSQDQQKLGALFLPRHWEKLVPDTSNLFITGGSSNMSVERASDGTWGAAYLPSQQGVTVNLGSFAQPISGKWFNPATAAITVIAGSPFAPVGSVNVSPPSSGDWILLFE